MTKKVLPGKAILIGFAGFAAQAISVPQLASYESASEIVEAFLAQYPIDFENTSPPSVLMAFCGFTSGVMGDVDAPPSEDQAEALVHGYLQTLLDNPELASVMVLATIAEKQMVEEAADESSEA